MSTGAFLLSSGIMGNIETNYFVLNMKFFAYVDVFSDNLWTEVVDFEAYSVFLRIMHMLQDSKREPSR